MINNILDSLPIVSCQEATRLASVSMERHLTVRETVNLKLHLMVCNLCVNFSKHIEGLRLILRSYQPSGEQKLSNDAKNKIQQTLNNNINNQ